MVGIEPSKCTIDDVDAMYEIEKDLFPENLRWPKDAYYKVINGWEHECVKKTNSSGNIEGFIIWRTFKTDPMNVVHIENVDVEKSSQRMGIGSSLMKFVERNVVKPSIFILEVSVDNEPAISMYKKLGFKKAKEWRQKLVVDKDGRPIPCNEADRKCGRIENYYGNRLHAFKMAKEVHKQDVASMLAQS